MGDQFTVDDWLPPLLGSAQEEPAFSVDFLAEHEGELALLDQPLSPCLSDDELVDQLFEQPNRQTASMRTAFSLNDLQTLALEPQPVWHRVASIKPTLESVPEGDPPPSVSNDLEPVAHTSSGLYEHQPSEYQAGPFQQHSPAGLDPNGNAKNHAPYMAQPPFVMPHYHHETCYAPGMVTGPVYPPMPGHGYPGHPMPLPVPMPGPMRMPGSMPLPGPMPSMAPGMAHTASSPRIPPPVAMMQARSSNPGSDAGTSAPGSFVQGSPEHHMADIVKADPSADTDSSANSQPRKLQPSAATMRKSHSALELGAWRKMATGDLDFVDPSGSVRETLQGLEFCQQIGKLTAEERLQKILRYRAKRQLRNFNRTIKYQCRKSLADTRPRVRGRFARDNEPGSVLPHETKKAIREKVTKTKSPPPSAQPSGQLPDADQQPPLVQVQVQVQPQSVAAATASAAKRESAPLQPPGGQFGPAMVTASSFGNGSIPGAEHHVTALAHLYNQWSEVVGPEVAQG